VLKRLRLLRSSRLTLGALAREAAGVHGRRVAHHLEAPLPYQALPPTSISFDDVAAWVGRAAGVLTGEMGIRPGDRVLLCAGNRVDYLWWLLACAAAGAVVVPANAQSKAEELAWLAADGACTAVITRWDIFRTAIGRKARLPGVRSWGLTDGGGRHRGFHDLVALCDAAATEAAPRAGDPSELAGIFYTSGTTGRPKGVMLTHRSLLSHVGLAALRPPLPGELVVDALPIAHIMGLAVSLFAFVSGLASHHMERFDAEAVLAAIEGLGATVFAGVPTMYQRMEELGAATRDLRSVRAWVSGADVMPPELMARFKSYGRSVSIAGRGPDSVFLEGYGSVELGGGAMLRLSLPGRRPSDPGFVGFPVPPWRARIVGADGEPLRPGQTGDLELSGPGVSDGYLGDASATDEAFRAGWHRTGDLAWRDRLGLIHFAARAKEVIKSGGYSVYPAEVESLLAIHPDVERAVVYGLPHPRLGTAPAASVVLREGAEATAEELRAWARASMADYKAPRHLRLITNEDLPLGHTDKVLRRELARTHGPDSSG